MPEWLSIANGPIFRFTIAVLVLGLLRLAVLTVIQMFTAVARAGDRRIPYPAIIKDTLGWLFPFRRIHQARRGYSYASYVFHIGIILAGLFLSNHIEILKASLGISWPAVWKPLLDLLSLAAIAGGAYILLQRIYVTGSRRLSTPMDYLLLIFILNLFISGFLAGQSWNPFPYNGLMLFHVLNGIVLLLLIPFTKIAHCILYPLIRLSSEIGWHFPPRAGQQVIESLYGPEGRKI